MLTISQSKTDLENALDIFNWSFKIGDNIKYNLITLFQLIEDYNSGKQYGKPISVISVSIIEAIMVDFIYRLYIATKHFPASLRSREYEIKSKLQGETIKKTYKTADGSKVQFSQLKMFNFIPMIEVYEELGLLGVGFKYKILIKLAYFRNRVHIENYHENFEKDEGDTFSEKRVQTTINIMLWFFDYFSTNYKRDW